MTDTTDQVQLKTGIRTLRCMESKEKTTENNNKQLAQIYEICDDSNQAFNGKQVRFWQTLTPKGLAYVNLHRRSLGLPNVTADDLPTLRAQEYEGLKGKALVKVEVKPEVDDDGNKLADPFTGKPIVKTLTNLDQWFAPPSGS